MKSSRQQLIATVLKLGTAALLLGAVAMLGQLGYDSWRSRRDEAAITRRVPTGASRDCGDCHREIYDTWVASHHARAHRPVDAAADAPAFAEMRRFTLHGVQYEIAWKDGKPAFLEQHANRPPHTYTAEYVLGYTPLRQYVVPVGGGRYQLTDLAFDPKHRDWFNAFGAEQRQPGEWGHWTGRGMNWNSMCAPCHLTEYSKNYDAATDTYASTWREHGVGCVQCHGDLTPDHAHPGYRTPKALQQRLADRPREQQTCAPCHARNEMMTGAPRPGQPYHDHFRVTLPTEAATFYPDGQVRAEDFNWTSLLTSRMGGKAGVTCLDCHEPHSGKTRLPAANNALCQSCHGAPNAKNAPIIDPLAHSHHKPDSTGNQCVACHMPTTTYMERDPRHDHGFLKPDPLLTKELGIPNACDRCHADKGIDWQIEANERWYGEKLNSRQRQRARVVAAAQGNGPGAADRLLEMIRTEDVPAWKATLLQLATGLRDQQPALAEAARTALKDSDPLVRAAAVRVLSGDRTATAAIKPLLQDPTRLVRLDAAWALSGELESDSSARRELDAYLRYGADQPTGQLRLGQDFANRGLMADAVKHLQTAIEWDPYSPPFYSVLGALLDSTGRSAEAAETLARGTRLNPRDAVLPFEAGLAYAAVGRTAEAEASLREATRRDAKAARAWYNLALLIARDRRLEAVALLTRAEAIEPSTPDYPFARATLLLQAGDTTGARAALDRTLTLAPGHPQAAALRQQLR